MRVSETVHIDGMCPLCKEEHQIMAYLTHEANDYAEVDGYKCQKKKQTFSSDDETLWDKAIEAGDYHLACADRAEFYSDMMRDR